MAQPALPAQNFIDKNKEVDPSRLFRDARSGTQKFADFVTIHQNIAILVLATAVAVFVEPSLLPIGLIILPIALFWARSHPEKLPLRLPMASGVEDPSDAKPGRKKYRKARGIFYLGNDMLTGEECWIAKEDLLTHMLFFGTTGAGKTYTLTGASANYLSMGGGLIYVDAKAAASLALDIDSMACALGRDDDVLVMNFITGSEQIDARSRNRISNTLNFMAKGSASSVGDILNSLLSADEGGGNAVFKGQAVGLMRSTVTVLVDLRNHGKITLGANTLREWMFSLEKLMSLSDKCKAESGAPAKQEYASLQRCIRPESMEALNAYLGGIPGFSFSKKPSEQGEDANKQFGFARMYWASALSMFADDYRHVFWTDIAEVDMPDVVRNRRILVTLLPALEKSPTDLQNIGKIVLSALKAAVAAMLDGNLTGRRAEKDRAMPACPGGIILDEYAYITVEGFAVLPAQARGLGIGLVFAGQDYPGFKRANEKEAGQVIGNTNTKVIMKLEDSSDTWQLVKEMAGDAMVTQSAGFSQGQGATQGYQDNQNASIETRSRVNLGDLKSFIEGEALVFFQDRIVRTFMFSHEMKKNKDALFSVHEFLPLIVKKDDIVATQLGAIPRDVARIEALAAALISKGLGVTEPGLVKPYGLVAELYPHWLGNHLEWNKTGAIKPQSPDDFLKFCADGLFAGAVDAWSERKSTGSSTGVNPKAGSVSSAPTAPMKMADPGLDLLNDDQWESEENNKDDDLVHTFDAGAADSAESALAASRSRYQDSDRPESRSYDDKNLEQVRAILLSLANLVPVRDNLAEGEGPTDGVAAKAAEDLSHALTKEVYPDDPKPEARTTEMDERMNKYLGLMRSAMKNIGPS